MGDTISKARELEEDGLIEIGSMKTLNVLTHKRKKVALIGISGKIGSGKDTAAAMIQEGRPYDNRKFAGKLKQICGILLNVDPKQFESQEFKSTYLPDWGMTVREFLQRMGTEAVRGQIHDNAWVMSTMSGFNPDTEAWIITDVRFPNEAKAILDAGGIMIRIERDTEAGRGVAEHPSETSLDGRTDLFTYTILNNSTLRHLKDCINHILREEGL
jgi:hypothetical protein